jgi:hypothetical protein
MTTKIIHISLTKRGNDSASLIYFEDNRFNYQEYTLPLDTIRKFINKNTPILSFDRSVRRDFLSNSENNIYKNIGERLYKFLNHKDILKNVLDQRRTRPWIIAITTDQGLAHIPWELLHDGKEFLVEKQPSIVPVRWMSNGDEPKPIKCGVDKYPKNRNLNLLFMATSPLDASELGYTELDYEAEEGRILKATEKSFVELIVEESGCLEYLSELFKDYEDHYFDVFHLTGHGNNNGNAYFLTENEYGYSVRSSASDIVRGLANRLPPLIFLSGCKTGYLHNGTEPSMAEELLKKGATAVISWGELVDDSDATATAAQLYKDLSRGTSLTEAIANTYGTLVTQNNPLVLDWYKLRIYISDTLPEVLVKPPARPQTRQALNNIDVSFWDSKRKLRVVSRNEFVGRRRQLQNCLRILKKRDEDQEKIGVLIHGMGGLGKSSIASRLCHRLTEYAIIVLWQQITEFDLITKIKETLLQTNLDYEDLTQRLSKNNISLKDRLIDLFNQLAQRRGRPFLFILDDFEWNLDPNKSEYTLKAHVGKILEELINAIQITGNVDRIIITCRYDFDSDLLESFYKQGLQPFRGAELTKKLSRLPNFSSDKISDDLQNRALILADGNPRLLEFLNNEVLSEQDAEVKLTELEQSPELWKDRIIWEELYQLIDEPLQKILSYCLIYEIPVPMAALEAVCDELPNYKQQLQRGLNLGLIEVSPEVQEENRVYRVSRILPHIIPNIKLPEVPKAYFLYQIAHDKSHQLWGNKENRSKERWQEVFRLLFANKENYERFRQGFYEMLEVQVNPGADEAFVRELRKCANELGNHRLCTQLENYLQQQHWKEADAETAWIFHQVMVKENYKNWGDMLMNFPCETLKEIDQLWLQNTNNKFGISIQSEIYRNGGSPKIWQSEFAWGIFGESVGWKQPHHWLSYEELMKKLDKNNVELLPSLPSLPMLIYTRCRRFDVFDDGDYACEPLFSRFETCKF